MTRVIIHAGFHKTGTTSLQAFLERNAQRLRPHMAVYQKTELKRARYLGRWYGQRPVFWRRWLFRLGFRAFLRSVPDAPVIVISRESLSGMMLGLRGARLRPARRYAPMAIPLAREIIRETRRRFGPDVRIEFLYTTRAPRPFVNSLWRHVLRTNRLTQNEAQFAAGFSPLPDLEAEARAIRQAIAPVPVHTAALEGYADHPFGPAQALLDLLDIPPQTQAELRPIGRRNPGQSETLSQEFLKLNRGKMRGRKLYETKEALAIAEHPPQTRRKPQYRKP